MAYTAGALLQPGNAWPTGCGRAATDKTAVFFKNYWNNGQTLAHLRWWLNIKAIDCLVPAALWVAFSHLRGAEAILPAVPMEQSQWTFQKCLLCGLVTGLLSHLQEPSCTSCSGFAKFMPQDSYRVCSGPWKQSGQPESWLPCGIP